MRPPKHASNAPVILDGANFDSWLPFIRRRLKSHTLREYVEQAIPTNPGRDWRERSAEAAVMLCVYVASHLLLQIPAIDLLDAFTLLGHLRRLSRPFDFLGLPPVLRNRIYDLALPSTRPDKPYALAYDECHGRQERIRARRLPGLANKVCRQIRAEALPLFISTRHFSIEIHYMKLQTAKKFDDIIRSWAKNAARDYLRHLRHLDLDIKEMTYSPGGFGGFYSFVLSDKLGLRITCKDMKTTLKSPQHTYAVKQHEIEMEKDRQVLGLKGEGIVMAITRKPELWV